MATRKVHSIYKASDVHLFRLQKIASYVAKGVMYEVFREGTKNKPDSQNLFDFCKDKGVPEKKFRNNLNKKQIQLVESDLEGKSYDITLLFQCIQWASDDVANKNDDQWKEGNDCLESNLTAVKNRRNELFHGEPSYDKKQFLEQIKVFRLLLTKVLEQAGTRYGIEQAVVNRLIRDLNSNINLLRDSSLVPIDFESYKKLSLFSEKKNYVEDEGALSLLNLYRGWVVVYPASLLSKIDLKVDEIYTEMILVRESSDGSKIVQDFRYILDGIQYSNHDPVILVEGLAGSGKSTLTKKILSDWMLDQSTMTNLDSYHLLLYTEFRKKSIKSFRDLLNFLMPEIAKSFQNDDFSCLVLNLRVIIILDGLDEMNSSSVCLFEEILELKKTHGISVIVTTRPERTETYYQLAKANQIQTKHIKITGIPAEKREEFVLKYHEEMKKKGESKKDIRGLLKYLKRTASRLSHLWCLPYNLTLLIILWVYKSQVVNVITTAPELYWEIHQLYRSKLIDRLRGNEKTHHLEESSLEDKVDAFLSVLSYEALLSLENADIDLIEEAFRRLKDACDREELPTEEMTGAFLKRITTNTPFGYETKYSFPHKGLQDFLAALYIFRKVALDTENSNVVKTLKDVGQALNKNGVAVHEKESILRFVRNTLNRSSVDPTEQTSFVGDILYNLRKSTGYDIMKYQNMLVALIGLFHLKSNIIKDSIKIEVLNLLRETGVRSREDWLNILDSVKCDETVATFLSKQHNIFQGEIAINDSNLYAFASLLQVMKPPIENANKVTLIIHVSEDTPVINTLLCAVNENKMNVKSLRLEHDFRNPANETAAWDAINQILQRCQLTLYKGSLTEKTILSKPRTTVAVSVSNEKSYECLRIFLLTYKEVSYDLCVHLDIETSNLKHSPSYMRYLFIPDVKDDDDITKAVEIAKKIKSTKSCYQKIFFPRCELSEGQMDDLTYMLEDEQTGGTVFPSYAKSSQETESSYQCGILDIDEW